MRSDNIHWSQLENHRVIDRGHCFVTETGALINWSNFDSKEAQRTLTELANKHKPFTEMSLDIKEVLSDCTINGLVVKLPARQLDKKLYDSVNLAISKIGGKWKGGKIAGFVFEEDPTELIADITLGVKRNIKNEFQFFSTPDDLCDRIVKMIDIQEGDTICEPSAGSGAFLNAIHRLHPEKVVHAFELMPLNRTKLMKLPNVKLAGEPDFLQCDQFGMKWDKIVANPPFSNNQDIDHIRMMYSRLKPKGKLISIASVHWQHSSKKKEIEFAEWLISLNAKVETLPKGTFKHSGTNTETTLITIQKAA